MHLCLASTTLSLPVWPDGMEDYFSYGAHFALRVLVLPVHPIRTSEYSKRLKLLRQNTRIPLADVPPSLSSSSGGSSSSTSIHALLAPTPTSRGFLNLELVEAWDKEQSWLEEFQVHRRIVAVIGILDCEEWANEADGLAEGATAFEQQVQELELERPIFAKRCYAFNPAEEQKDNTKGLVVIPCVGDAAFYMHTLLAELSSGILAGLGGIVGSHCLSTVSCTHSLVARSWPAWTGDPTFHLRENGREAM